MTVVSFRVPRELKKRMRRVNENWSRDVRRLIEQIVKRQDRERVIDEIVSSFEGRRTIKAGTAARLVREDRDSH